MKTISAQTRLSMIEVDKDSDGLFTLKFSFEPKKQRIAVSKKGKDGIQYGKFSVFCFQFIWIIEKDEIACYMDERNKLLTQKMYKRFFRDLQNDGSVLDGDLFKHCFDIDYIEFEWKVTELELLEDDSIPLLKEPPSFSESIQTSLFAQIQEVLNEKPTTLQECHIQGTQLPL